MNYRVEWAPTAEQQLADVWLAARDRNAVTAASAWFDHQLEFFPLLVGRSWISSVYRLARHGPLGVEFEVIEDDKRVIVHGVFATD
ncbi:MAG: hypothetical protein K2P78_04220 [Gemmataceae bacterium]|nr:hypothetical protein [Gemmataceae bacterium]